MATFDKSGADNLVKHQGFFNGDDTPAPDNPRCIEITEYDNAFGGVGYGLTFEGEQNKYTPSEFVRNPRIYWKYSR
jgi:hypothetical protein